MIMRSTVGTSRSALMTHSLWLYSEARCALHRVSFPGAACEHCFASRSFHETS